MVQVPSLMIITWITHLDTFDPFAGRPGCMFDRKFVSEWRILKGKGEYWSDDLRHGQQTDRGPQGS